MTELFYNAKFFTGDSFAEAVLVENGRFVYVGTLEEAKRRHTGQKDIDLRKTLVLPGFNDSHMHLFGTAYVKGLLSLADTKSVEDVLERLKNRLESPDFQTPFLTARGFNQNQFDDKRLPTKAELDRVSTSVPIVITRICGHIAVANTAALQWSNITETTTIEGGSVDFESGLLTEKALGLLFTADLKPSIDDVKRLLKQSMAEAVKVGITTIQTDDLMHAFPAEYEKMIEVYRELDEAGELPIRLRLQSQLPTIDLLKDYIAKGYPNKIYSDRLKMGPLKILTDGTLGARTAAMLEPYSDDPTETGILTYSNETLYELVKTAHQAGMSVAMHAIGDAAMTQVLDAYERVLTQDPREDHRHCIIHCQITSGAILDRMAKLQVYAAVQPIFIDADMEIVWDRVGTKRAITSYAWKTMIDKGINVAFGTDAPVEDINPIENIRAAVTRTNRQGHTYLLEEALTAQEAILAYTYASAKQTRDEQELGKIAPGYFADFAVWNRNQFVHMKTDHLPKEALATYVGGTLVYAAKETL
jgi:hypothetical protein